MSIFIFPRSDVETTSFLDMLKLEKTVCFESDDWNSNIRVHSPLSRQSKFFQLLIIPHREKFRKMPLNAKEPIPSKLINKQGVEIEFPSRKQRQKQKIFKTTHVRKRYLIEALFYIYLDFKYQMFCISES